MNSDSSATMSNRHNTDDPLIYYIVSSNASLISDMPLFGGVFLAPSPELVLTWSNVAETEFEIDYVGSTTAEPRPGQGLA